MPDDLDKILFHFRLQALPSGEYDVHMHSAKETSTARTTITQTSVAVDLLFACLLAAPTLGKARSAKTGENTLKNIPALPMLWMRKFNLTTERKALSVFNVPNISMRAPPKAIPHKIPTRVRGLRGRRIPVPMLITVSLQLEQFTQALGLRAADGDFGLLFVVHFQ
jgi:hypothetical protein